MNKKFLTVGLFALGLSAYALWHFRGQINPQATPETIRHFDVDGSYSTTDELNKSSYENSPFKDRIPPVPHNEKVKQTIAYRKANPDKFAGWIQQSEENKEKESEFIEQVEDKREYESTDSGLKFKIIKKGEGKNPTEFNTAKIRFTSKFLDGKPFESSGEGNATVTVPVGGVLPGIKEALMLMNEGAKYEVILPSSLAYGELGRHDVPPNSVIIYELELVSIE